MVTAVGPALAALTLAAAGSYSAKTGLWIATIANTVLLFCWGADPSPPSRGQRLRVVHRGLDDCHAWTRARRAEGSGPLTGGRWKDPLRAHGRRGDHRAGPRGPEGRARRPRDATAAGRWPSASTWRVSSATSRRTPSTTSRKRTRLTSRRRSSAFDTASERRSSSTWMRRATRSDSAGRPRLSMWPAGPRTRGPWSVRRRPISRRGMLSAESPVARALRDRAPGEEVAVETPSGERTYRVEKIVS